MIPLQSMASNRLTVITYFHANEKQLHRCIEGLAAQSYKHFEWWVLTHNPITENIGIPYKKVLLPAAVTNKSEAYNYVLPQITTDYIAYNDGDDRSLPHRFALQVALLDQQPEISVCSGACVVNDTQPGWPVYSTYDDIVAFLLINNPIVNPAVMLRNLEGVWGDEIKYNPRYIRAQDYDFWFSCLKMDLQFYNFTDPLLSYYVPDVAPVNDTQENFAIAIRQDIWQWGGMSLDKRYSKSFDDFCIIRKMPEQELLVLMNYLKKKRYKKPFQNGAKIIANYLDTYITNHGMRDNEALLNSVSLLKKPYLLRLILEK